MDFLENIQTGIRRGSVEVITGSMFSGKTEELLRRLKRAQIAGLKVMVFKPALERRYSETCVVSHDERSVVSTPVGNASSMLLLAGDADVVAIDEAQFFDNSLTHACTALAASGIRVIVAGLDMDFTGKPFGPVPALMAIAEQVTKVHAICMRCGSLAQFSFRKTDDSRVALLGGKDIYEPLCRSCYNKALNEK
ncbi:MAG: thymidine kinase [Bacteroidales bacterium]|jgi:thymidine kinase|nr:thymidine kinase [Bacteroidales bacterium]